MMLRKWWVAILTIVLVVAVGLFFLPNDERKITKMLDELGKNCSSEKGETAFQTLKKAAAIAKLCANPCGVKIDSLKIDGHQSQREINDHALMMKKRLPGTIFSFHDTAIDVSGENSAGVVTTLKIEGKSVTGRFVDAYEIAIRMKKDQGDWYFSSFTVVEFLEK